MPLRLLAKAFFLISLLHIAPYVVESAFASPFPNSVKLKWKRVSSSLDLIDIQTGVIPLVSPRVVLARLSKDKALETRVVVTRQLGKNSMHAKEACSSTGSAVCINANFFDEFGMPLGLVVSRGRVSQRLHYGGQTLTGVFQVMRAGGAITHRSDAAPAIALEAIQAGPRLIVAGKRAPLLRELGESTRRSGLCIDNEERVIVYTVLPGISHFPLESVVSLLMRPEIACQDALNLDGGGSTQFFIGKDIPGAPKSHSAISIEGADRVPVFLAWSFQES